MNCVLCFCFDEEEEEGPYFLGAFLRLYEKNFVSL